jgi:hypothetical protein
MQRIFKPMTLFSKLWMKVHKRSYLNLGNLQIYSNTPG